MTLRKILLRLIRARALLLIEALLALCRILLLTLGKFLLALGLKRPRLLRLPGLLSLSNVLRLCGLLRLRLLTLVLSVLLLRTLRGKVRLLLIHGSLRLPLKTLLRGRNLGSAARGSSRSGRCLSLGATRISRIARIRQGACIRRLTLRLTRRLLGARLA